MLALPTDPAVFESFWARLLGMSDARFADGVRYRIEIPSVEGPDVMRAVLDEARTRDVPVRRVSQGSGVMMLTDAEITEMARLVPSTASR